MKCLNFLSLGIQERLAWPPSRILVFCADFVRSVYLLQPYRHCWAKLANQVVYLGSRACFNVEWCAQCAVMTWNVQWRKAVYAVSSNPPLYIPASCVLVRCQRGDLLSVILSFSSLSAVYPLYYPLFTPLNFPFHPLKLPHFSSGIPSQFHPFLYIWGDSEEAMNSAKRTSSDNLRCCCCLLLLFIRIMGALMTKMMAPYTMYSMKGL